MNNLNDYNIAQCQEYCKKLPFYHNIKNDFDKLIWNKQVCSYPEETPRELAGKRMFSMVSFFYLRLLLEKNPSKIYDLGAGWNIFKKYIPNIIGISATCNEDGYGDVHDYVDQIFIQGHQNYFDSVFSINALHFRSLADLKNIIQEFASMIAPDGRGFLALNLARMIQRTPTDFLVKEFKKTSPTIEQYELYTRNILADICLNYLIVDVDFTVVDEYMDGNIRIVFEK